MPIVLAMVICDAIHQDPATQKCTLLGTFSTITARNFPVVHPMLAIHIALTGGHGKTRIRLTLMSTQGEEQLFSQEGFLQFSDPRVVAEVNFGIRNLQIPHPGEYRVQVYANDELLSERRLHVFGIQPVGPVPPFPQPPSSPQTPPPSA